MPRQGSRTRQSGRKKRSRQNGSSSRSRSTSRSSEAPSSAPSGSRRSSGKRPRTSAASSRQSNRSGSRGTVREAVRMSMSAKAGVTFPVTKIKHMMKLGNYAPKVSDRAAVYLAAVLEYLSIEVLEIAGNVCRSNNMKRINPRHVLVALRADSDFGHYLKNVTIRKGGVVPNSSSE